jgi:hypothetical protein
MRVLGETALAHHKGEAFGQARNVLAVALRFCNKLRNCPRFSPRVWFKLPDSALHAGNSARREVPLLSGAGRVLQRAIEAAWQRAISKADLTP